MIKFVDSLVSTYKFRLHYKLLFIGVLTIYSIIHSKGKNNNMSHVILQSFKIR